jgi:hypothetical protein
VTGASSDRYDGSRTDAPENESIAGVTSAIGFIGWYVCRALLVAEEGLDVARAYLPRFPLFLDAACTIVRRAMPRITPSLS